MRFLPALPALAAAACLAVAMDLNFAARVVQLSIVVAGLWLLLPVHLYNWWSHVALFLLTGLAATAILQGGSTAWAVAAQCAALVAWDMAALAYTVTTYSRAQPREETDPVAPQRGLSRFLWRQPHALAPTDLGAFVRKRLIPLAAISGATVVMALVAERVSFTLTLPWALLLGLALVLLLARIVRRSLNPPA